MDGRRHVIGIDLGGTKLLAAVVDQDLKTHAKVRLDAPRHESEVVDVLVEAIERLQSRSEHPVEAVGLGVPCLIDARSGTAVMAVNLPIEGIQFADAISERTGLPTFVDNDANVAALAEQRFGAARGCDNVVMLTVGTGIGGGLILGGEVYRGAIGSGAELGHMTVELDGPPCQGNCPNRGCLEAVASGRALEREAQQLAQLKPESGLGQALGGGERITGPLVAELASRGDSAALEAFQVIGERLGAGVVGLINIFNPEMVVIGGGVAEVGDILLDHVRRVVAERALRPSRDFVEIESATFGNDAGTIGAATLAFAGVFAC